MATLKKRILDVFRFFFFYCGLEYLFSKLVRRKGVVILNYHSVGDYDWLPEVLGLSTPVRTFEKHIQYLVRRYNIISLEDLVDYVQGKKDIPANSVVITFDDGYEDNYLNAFPILKKYHLPATIFLASSFVDTNKWLPINKFFYYFTHSEATGLTLRINPNLLGSDGDGDAQYHLPLKTNRQRKHAVSSIRSHLQRLDSKKCEWAVQQILTDLSINRVSDNLPSDLRHLSWTQIREMADHGISIGSHTQTHCSLKRIPCNQIESEIMDSKKLIEQKIGRPIVFFAYPYGGRRDFDNSVKEIVRKSGHICACSCIRGASGPQSDLYELRRFNVNTTGPVWFLAFDIAITNFLLYKLKDFVARWLKR